MRKKYKSLENYIKFKLTDIVSDLDSVFKMPDDYKVTVANICFAYKNSELLEMLDRRGTCMGNSDLEGINKVTQEINDYVADSKNY